MGNMITKYLTKNPYFNDGKWITGAMFEGFTLHSVGTGQPDPMVFWNGWNKSSYTTAGINGFIGEEQILITAPCLETRGKVKRMPHAGNPWGNNRYIGFEMCEPASVHYTGQGASFTCSDLTAARAFCRKTYENAVELFAMLCKFHGKNPLVPGVIYSHNEMGKKGIGSGHVDPEHLWQGLGLPYTMDGFRQDVSKKMNEEEINMTKLELEQLIDQRATVIANERIKAVLTGNGTQVSNWAKEELEKAVAAGITDGTNPGGYTTREQTAAMVIRGLESLNPNIQDIEEQLPC